MSVRSLDDAEAAALAGLLPLFREINHLKRIRVAGENGSWAERMFARAWQRLCAGEELSTVAEGETADALVASLLAGIDDAVLASGGLAAEARVEILHRAFDAVAGPVDGVLARRLRATLGRARVRPGSDALPAFVPLLAAQPRAGATRPGCPRVVLEPAESHAEHCAVVAVNGVLAAGVFGADPGVPFLTGLAHHLHNAYLPDAGDAGDAVLGENLQPLMETFRARALAQLPEVLHAPVRRSLGIVYRADDPEARAFQVADSLDRVLEMDWHARSAAFTLDLALGEMDIIHPGPVQAFQTEVMQAVGWK